MIMHTRAHHLLPQFLMEQCDTLPIQCRHSEHSLAQKIFFDKMTTMRRTIFSLIWPLYMHRYCPHVVG